MNIVIVDKNPRPLSEIDYGEVFTLAEGDNTKTFFMVIKNDKPGAAAGMHTGVSLRTGVVVAFGPQRLIYHYPDTELRVRR